MRQGGCIADSCHVVCLWVAEKTHRMRACEMYFCKEVKRACDREAALLTAAMLSACGWQKKHFVCLRVSMYFCKEVKRACDREAALLTAAMLSACGWQKKHFVCVRVSMYFCKEVSVHVTGRLHC
jgi:hypothetical protein